MKLTKEQIINLIVGNSELQDYIEKYRNFLSLFFKDDISIPSELKYEIESFGNDNQFVYVFYTFLSSYGLHQKRNVKIRFYFTKDEKFIIFEDSCDTVSLIIDNYPLLLPVKIPLEKI